MLCILPHARAHAWAEEGRQGTWGQGEGSCCKDTGKEWKALPLPAGGTGVWARPGSSDKHPERKENITEGF